MTRRGKSQRWRRRIIVICTLVIAFTFAWFLTSRITSPLRAVRVFSVDESNLATSTPHPATLRIAAYNIAHGRGQAASNWAGGTRTERRQRLEAIADWMAQANLDIVVLNEVDFDSSWSGGVNQARIIAERAGFDHRVEQRNIDAGLPFFSIRFGNAILSRYPLDAVELLDWPTHSMFERLLCGKKRGVICEVEVDDETRYRVVAVHLEPRDPALRLQSAKMIAELAQVGGPPLIAAGDFNSRLSRPASADAGANGPTAISFLLGTGLFNSGLTAAPGPEDFTFPAWQPARTIDWILAPPDCSIVERVVPQVAHSDHLPVVVELRLAEDD